MAIPTFDSLQIGALPIIRLAYNILGIWTEHLVPLVVIFFVLLVASFCFIIKQLRMALKRAHARIHEVDLEAQRQLQVFLLELQATSAHAHDAEVRSSLYRSQMKEQRTRDQTNDDTIVIYNAEIKHLQAKIHKLEGSLRDEQTKKDHRKQMYQLSLSILQSNLNIAMTERDEWKKQAYSQADELATIKVESKSYRTAYQDKLLDTEAAAASLCIQLANQDRETEITFEESTISAKALTEEISNAKKTIREQFSQILCLQNELVWSQEACAELEGSLDFSRMEYTFSVQMYERKLLAANADIMSLRDGLGQELGLRRTPAEKAKRLSSKLQQFVSRKGLADIVRQQPQPDDASWSVVDFPSSTSSRSSTPGLEPSNVSSETPTTSPLLSTPALPPDQCIPCYDAPNCMYKNLYPS